MAAHRCTCIGGNCGNCGGSGSDYCRVPVRFLCVMRCSGQPHTCWVANVHENCVCACKPCPVHAHAHARARPSNRHQSCSAQRNDAHTVVLQHAVVAHTGKQAAPTRGLWGCQGAATSPVRLYLQQPPPLLLCVLSFTGTVSVAGPTGPPSTDRRLETSRAMVRKACANCARSLR